jgi:hypothetical protein
MFAGLCLGCTAPDAPAGSYPSVSYDAGQGTEEQGAPDSSGGGPLLAEGTWLLWYETSTCVDVMSVAIESLTQTMAVVQLQRDPGGVVHHRLRNCLIEQTPIVGVATAIPASVIDSLAELQYVALLFGDGLGSTYDTQESIELWGVKLTDPEHDPLPTDSSDPRVYDQDKDGKPGVTLVLGDGQCTMAVIQRGRFRWKGAIASPTRIEGGGYNLTTQVVMEASSGFCSSTFATWNPPNTARFAMIRVDGKNGAKNLDTNLDDTVTCDEVRAYGSAPFQPRTPDNKRCDGDR